MLVSPIEVKEQILKKDLDHKPFEVINGAFLLCNKGSGTIRINLIPYDFSVGSLIILVPGMLIQYTNLSSDTCFFKLIFSSVCVSKVNLIKRYPEVFMNMINAVVIDIPESRIAMYQEFITQYLEANRKESITVSSEFALSLLNTMFIAISDNLREREQQKREFTRGEIICRSLSKLILEHYQTERAIRFYANKLNITPQHLCTTVKKNCGNSVSNLIAHFVIMDAKGKLSSTELTIQEIAESLNFKSTSIFSKYFKRYVDMTPMEYRNLKKQLQSPLNQ